MHVSFKAYKLRVRLLSDTTRSFNEKPIHSEFRLGFYDNDGFNMVLFDLVKKTYTSFDYITITKITSSFLEGASEKSNVKIIYDIDDSTVLENKTISNIFINAINTPIEMEYVGEKDMLEKSNAAIRKQFIIKAIKNNGEIKAAIEEGNYAILEIDFAISKIKQKLIELTFLNYESSENGQFEIVVSFFKDPSLKAQVDIESVGFDLETIKKVVESLKSSMS